ncbi:hypothetical protein EYC84_011082 [Monilinia fructicola]|uniref:Uncharacterized protein n=1 Tax=Monilinia fructicola TaxID=38448 RepID=A0A5M9JDV2_MONFR|nr:hypothetical protein EYC84_011082 [Monilinia fructicola]
MNSKTRLPAHLAHLVRPVRQSISQSISQSVSPSVSQSVSQSVSSRSSRRSSSRTFVVSVFNFATHISIYSYTR